MRPRAASLISGLIAAVMVLSGIAVAAPVVADTAPPDPAATVAADALPTVQVDGVVWSQDVIGNTVYAGGNFTTVRPAGTSPGSGQVSRTHLLAYNITTGNLITSFAPTINGQVRVIDVSPDGSRLYIGGDFTQINGQNRFRIAAFDTATGQLVSGFTIGTNAQVRALDATNTTVYFGGEFSNAGGQQRLRVAAANAANGALLSWNPSADATVTSLTLNPSGSKVILGGAFRNLGTTPAYGMAAVHPTTAASLSWAASSKIRNAGPNSAITSLETDGVAVYGSGYHFGAGGNLEGSFRADGETGAIVWLEDCHGDTVSVFPTPQVLYKVGHAHYCGNIGGFPQTEPWTMYHSLAMTNFRTGTVTGPDPYGYYNWAGEPAPTLLNWFPKWDGIGFVTQQGQAGWSVTGNSQYISIGGEFQRVNGTLQQSLVRMAIPSIAPNDVGPNNNPDLKPTVTSYKAGQARITWRETFDPDNRALTYKVFRNYTSQNDTPVFSTLGTSFFWQRQGMSFTDTGLVPGQTYSYRVYAYDQWNNFTFAGATSVTVATPANERVYAGTVLEDGASAYWRLDEPSGSTVADIAGGDGAIAGAGTTRGIAGALLNDTNSASSFNGSTNGFASTQSPKQAPQQFSIEAWVRTTSTSGGKIAGFGGSRTGNSGNYDRHLYFDNAGRVIFGVYPGGVRTLESAPGLNNGQWHHVVGTLGPAGMALYVDGNRIAQRVDTTSGQSYSGYWRIGGDNLSGWPRQPSSFYLNGTIDEVAVYPTALSQSRVVAHYNASGRTSTAPNQPPTAAFTASPAGLTVNFNGTGSADPDGSIAGYSWNFGDQTPAGTGATPSHTYAAAGSYTVVLTVTDNNGATDTETATVTVAPAPNQPPTAAFTASPAGLTVNFNGTGSADPDGSIAGYSWNFGDQTPAGTGATPSHTYAAAGSYTVVLTVTDNNGANDTESASVTVSAALVTDTFSRTTSNGWGNAEVGGTWTLAGDASGFSVTSGMGRLRVASAGWSAGAYLGGVTGDVDVSTTIGVDKPATGGGTYLSLIPRGNGSSAYRAKVHLRADGSVALFLSRAVGGSETTLSGVVVPGLTYTAGDSLVVRAQVIGANPATIRAKVWKLGTVEPVAWTQQNTDGTAALQTLGGMGLLTYVSGSATNAPVVVSVDDFAARRP